MRAEDITDLASTKTFLVFHETQVDGYWKDQFKTNKEMKEEVKELKRSAAILDKRTTVMLAVATVIFTVVQIALKELWQ